ncbi:hypothetical protein EYY60_16635 [Flavobacterium zhairuonense]|uniref:hypothetical protein n=1 Tax=Flavobacterium zhairuonense TaxID=2493631 RepID=UPI0010491534|nr:hypothetical protein [Flavobacterium zhairuonense]KAF2508746.1 hypothetical protein EYY60_16635 [Flavobacterium zhairuonense]
MKTISKFIFIFLLVLNYGCSNDSIACFTPPEDFSFELIDKTTGENLFTYGTYKSSDITIKDLNDSSKNIEYNFISENNYNVIRIGSIGWKTETINYSVNIARKSIFEFHVQANRISGKCSYTEFKDFQIKNATFQLDQTRGVYKILVDTKI